MKKLTLEHICCYLPYGLKVKTEKSDNIVDMYILTQHSIQTRPQIHGLKYCSFSEFKPILLPLSDLTKPITHKGETFVPIEKLFNTGMRAIKVFEDRKSYCIAYGDDNNPVVFKISKDVLTESYYHIQKLYEWHFDVHGLIPAGLAIDVNTLPENPYK